MENRPVRLGMIGAGAFSSKHCEGIWDAGKSVCDLISAGLPTKREGGYKGGGIEKVDKEAERRTLATFDSLIPLLAFFAPLSVVMDRKWNKTR